MKIKHNMNVTEYLKNVIAPIVAVTVVSVAFAVWLKSLLGDGVLQSLTEIAACLFATGVAVYVLGMTKTERKHFQETVFRFLKHH